MVERLASIQQASIQIISRTCMKINSTKGRTKFNQVKVKLQTNKTRKRTVKLDMHE
jgi:ribosomal protein S28E/S33